MFGRLWAKVWPGLPPVVLLILMAVSIKHIVVSAAGSWTPSFIQAVESLPGRQSFYFGSSDLPAGPGDRIFCGFRLSQSLFDDAHPVAAGGPGGSDPPDHRDRILFRGWFFEYDLSDQSVLLIALGLTVVGYPKWLRWTLPLWGMIVLITLAFLALGVAIGYGPF